MQSHPDRNEPLLPRSASFGGGTRAAIGNAASSLALTCRRACSGDLGALRSACLLGTCSVLVVGLLGVLNPFALLSPLHWLASLYIVVFAASAAIYEADPPALERFRRWLAVELRVLTRSSGRGVTYVLLGTISAGLGDPLALVAGLFEVGVGAACLWSSFTGRIDDAASEADSEYSRQSEGDTARSAFRRRVLFGMDRMDSAELVSLCLELGLTLNARTRVQALEALDPQQGGHITEEAFVAWWAEQQRASGATRMPSPPGPLGAGFSAGLGSLQ